MEQYEVIYTEIGSGNRKSETVYLVGKNMHEIAEEIILKKYKNIVVLRVSLA